MSIESLFEKVESMVDDFLLLNAKIVTNPENLGLDSRSGNLIYISEDFIAVNQSGKNRLNYYGGFEYVEDRYKFQICEFFFYLSEDERVRKHIGHFFESQE